MKRFLLILVFFSFISYPAYAYLDPGLGSLIIQSVIGLISVTLGFFVIFKNKVISLYKKLSLKFGKSNLKNK